MLALLFACTTHRMIRLENRVLAMENTRLREAVTDCGAPADQGYATTVTPDTIREYIARAGLPAPEETGAGVFLIAVEGKNTGFRIAVQLFAREQILFVTTLDYMQLNDVDSPSSMILLLTRLAALNYEMLVGKYQLNIDSGDISLSVEQHLDDGLGYSTFEALIRHEIDTADRHFPELISIAKGEML